MTLDGIADYNLNGAKFTTYDRDNDGGFRNCALYIRDDFIGGFWYATSSRCGYALVNQNALFQWNALPIGTQSRSNQHVALQKSRMTLIRK